MPFEDLDYSLVIQSGNDAAITLAEGISGTEDNFAELMNKRAAELAHEGHSHFTNAWGKERSCPPRHRARHGAARRAYHSGISRNTTNISGEKDFTWNKIHQLNRNPLLTMDIGYADGLKTGDTAESG